MNHSARRIAFLLPLLFVACGKKEQAAPAPEVSVVPVVQKDVPIVSTWIGTLDGSVNADIRPKLEGYLLRQAYKEGQFVRAGTLLFEIDPRQFQAQSQQAKGALGQAQAQLAKANRDVERFTPLAQDRAISQQELDNANSAQRNAQAAVDAAQASVDQAALYLAWARVTSPIDGVVGIAKVQVGDLVNTNTVMTTVSTVDPIRVTFGISEREYLRFAERINEPAYATTRQGPFLEPVRLDLVLDDGSVWKEKGRAELADREVDQRTGTMTIRAFFPNPGNILRPGQYGQVRAAIATREAALLVPQRAVMELQGSYRIAVVGPDDKVDIHAIEAGERSGDLWIVNKGVKPDDKVIVTGLQYLKPGLVVKTKPWVPDAPAASASPSASPAAR